MDFKYTKHQTARGARADEETFDKIYLIKHVSELRATYQIKVLAFSASQQDKKLVLRLPKITKLHSSLVALRKSTGSLITVERY